MPLCAWLHNVRGEGSPTGRWVLGYRTCVRIKASLTTGWDGGLLLGDPVDIVVGDSAAYIP